MRYLLDTCVISDFIKGETGTKIRLKQTPPVDIAVSAITVMELRYGLALNPQRAQTVEPAIASFLSSVTILPFSTVEAEQAAQIRAVLKSQGQPMFLVCKRRIGDSPRKLGEQTQTNNAMKRTEQEIKVVWQKLLAVAQPKC